MTQPDSSLPSQFRRSISTDSLRLFTPSPTQYDSLTHNQSMLKSPSMDLFAERLPSHVFCPQIMMSPHTHMIEWCCHSHYWLADPNRADLIRPTNGAET